MAQIVNQYSGSIRVPAHVEQVLNAFNDFAGQNLHRWQSKPNSDGVTTFQATSTHQRRYGVEMRPVSLKARFEEAIERNKHVKRYGLLGKKYSRKRPVGFFYKVVFTFAAASSMATDVSYVMTEEIDNDNSVAENLVRDYAVPALAIPEIQIGESFLEFTKTLP